MVLGNPSRPLACKARPCCRKPSLAWECVSSLVGQSRPESHHVVVRHRSQPLRALARPLWSGSWSVQDVSKQCFWTLARWLPVGDVWATQEQQEDICLVGGHDPRRVGRVKACSACLTAPARRAPPPGVGDEGLQSPVTVHPRRCQAGARPHYARPAPSPPGPPHPVGELTLTERP